jgi:hypothetical protein
MPADFVQFLQQLPGRLLRSVIALLEPGPGLEPDPDPVEIAPVVQTLAVDPVGETTATLQGSLVSLGSPQTAVDVLFEWRVGTSGEWTATTPQELTAPGGFSQALTGLDEDTLHEVRAIARWGSPAQEVTGGVISFTTGGASEQPDEVWDDVIGSPLKEVKVESLTFAGDVSGVTWAQPSGSFRGSVPSLVKENARQTINMRGQHATIPAAQFGDIPSGEWTLAITVQPQPNNYAANWGVVFARGRPWLAAADNGEITVILKANGGARLGFRNGANHEVDLPDESWELGDSFILFVNVNDSGTLRFAINDSAWVTKAGAGSLTNASTKPWNIGAYEDGGAIFRGAHMGVLLWDETITDQRREDMVAQLVTVDGDPAKTGIRWTPPLSVTLVEGDQTTIAVPGWWLMDTAEPLPEIVTQPSNAEAFAGEGLTVSVAGTTEGVSDNGRYRLVGASSNSADAVLNVTVTEAAEVPSEVAETTVGVGQSGAIVDSLTASATWHVPGDPNTPYQPQLGDQLIAVFTHRSGEPAAPSIPGYTQRLWVTHALSDSNARMALGIFVRDAGSSEPAGATVTATSNSQVRASLILAATRLTAGWSYSDFLNSSSNVTDGKTSTSLTVPAAETLASVIGAWAARRASTGPDFNDLSIVGVELLNSGVMDHASQGGLRSAVGSKFAVGGEAVTVQAEYE